AFCSPHALRTGARSQIIAAVPAVIEAEVVVEVVRILIVLHILAAALVEQAIVAPAGVVAGRRRPSDIVDAGLTGEFAARGPPPPGARSGGAGGGTDPAMRPRWVPNKGTKAGERERAADHAGGGRGGGAEKRAAGRRRRSRRPGRHRLHWLGCGLPGGRHGWGLARPHPRGPAAGPPPGGDALTVSTSSTLIACGFF